MRLATHCTEADIAVQHIGKARDLGMDVAGFLMTSHMSDPESFAQQALLMEDAGAHCVYITDSGGRLTMGEARDWMRAHKAVFRPDTEVGIHAHHNLTFGVANPLVAVEEGCYRVGASLAGMGAGAGNCPLDAFIAVAKIEGWQHGCDVSMLMEVGSRRMVGGQEDMIVDIALDIANAESEAAD